MSYNNNIPLASDFLSVSQPQIRTNFNQLDVIAQVNHFNLTSSNKGKHKIVSMPQEQGAVPSSGTDEIILYTQNLTTANEPELMMARESSASKGSFPLSRYPVMAAGSFVTISGTGDVSYRTEFPPTNVGAKIVVATNPLYPITFGTALSSTEYVVLSWSKNSTTLTYNTDATNISTSGFTLSGTNLSGSGKIIYFIVLGGFF